MELVAGHGFVAVIIAQDRDEDSADGWGKAAYQYLVQEFVLTHHVLGGAFLKDSRR